MRVEKNFMFVLRHCVMYEEMTESEARFWGKW